MEEAILYIINGSPPYLVLLAFIMISTSITIIVVTYLYFKFKISLAKGTDELDSLDEAEKLVDIITKYKGGK